MSSARQDKNWSPLSQRRRRQEAAGEPAGDSIDDEGDFDDEEYFDDEGDSGEEEYFDDEEDSDDEEDFDDGEDIDDEEGFDDEEDREEAGFFRRILDRISSWLSGES